MIRSFLIIGQSNMAGRGKKEEVAPISNPNLLVLRNGRWQSMYVPVNCDRPFSGVSLAESFIDEYSKAHPDVLVGIIPCADGGTSVEQWCEGGLLFDNAIYQTRLAERTSDIAGVLWHQGEGNIKSDFNDYREKLSALIRAFRKENALKDAPFILGGLGCDFLKNFSQVFKERCRELNETIKKVAETNPRCGYVSADNLTANDDNLHFNAKSLREFGKRYFKVFSETEDKNRVYNEKPREDGAIRSAMELL